MRSVSVSSVNKEIDQLCADLGCLEKGHGLEKEFAKERRKADGPNELYKPKPPGLGLLFLMQLTNFIIVLLIVSGIGSILVNATNPARSSDPMSYVEGIAIFLIVLLNAGIAAVTEKGAND